LKGLHAVKFFKCTMADVARLRCIQPSALPALIQRCSCVGQLMGGGESGPEVMQVMQQIAASIGSYSAAQAASAPSSAADILENASKEFLVCFVSISPPRFVGNPPHQCGSAAGGAAAGLDFGGVDGLDDEELNGPMQVACSAAAMGSGGGELFDPCVCRTY
jgi:hypothetical protein